MKRLIGALMFLAAEGSEPTSGGAAPAQPAAPAAPAEGGQQPAADAPKVEAKVEPKPAEPKAAPPAPKPEREERDVQARLELKRRTAELAEREGKLKLSEADVAELAAHREALRFAAEDPIGYLERAKLTAEGVFKAAKEGRKVDPVARKALLENEAMKKRLDERDAAESKAKADATAQETDRRLRGTIGQIIKSEGDRFELIAANGDLGVEAVHEGLLKYAEKYNRGPDLETAKKIADNVEKFYRGQADKYGESKYFKAKSAPKPKAAAAPAAEPEAGLSNDLDAAATPKPKPKASTERTITSQTNDIQSDWEAVKRERAAREAANGR